MNIPIEIISAFLAIALTATLAERRAMWKAIGRIEKQNIIIITMLHLNGFDVPEKGDTDRFLKANNL